MFVKIFLLPLQNQNILTMTTAIKTLFFLIRKGKVILCESNLRDFIAQFPKEIADIRKYDYYYRRFKESDFFQFEFNEKYYFQKMEYNREEEE